MPSPLYELEARFLMDGGRPSSVEAQDDDGNRVECFDIETLVTFAPAAGPRLRRVTFLLDSSFEEPLRKATRERNEFVEEITSYGDFAVVAKIETEDDVHAEVGWLSDLLTKGHADDEVPSIRRAITAIKAN